MPILGPVRTVPPELDARDCGCDVKSHRVTAVDYARAPYPPIDDPVGTDSIASGLSIVVGCPTGGPDTAKGPVSTASKGIRVALTPDK